MKTSWKSFKQWCHAHPFKFAFFISLSGAVSDVAMDFGSDAMITSMLVLAALFTLVCSYDMIRMGLMSISLDAPGAIPVKRKDGTFYNKRAGYDRNVRMGVLADELLAFHADGSKGTQNMIDVMRRLKKGVTIVYLKP